ncbi:hypothetical protein N8069_03170, partial [Flavobacteriaceae bacterium]|nr:hypothetical protein [Flavobacteriaceae bacterium]
TKNSAKSSERLWYYHRARGKCVLNLALRHVNTPACIEFLIFIVSHKKSSYFHTMEPQALSNPFMLIFGGIILLVVLYFWNKKNQTSLKSRRSTTFKQRYAQRKKTDQEKR